MKKLYIAICTLTFSLLSSCIESYDVVMEDTDNEILIVEGQIVGGSESEFILQRSFCKQEDYVQDGPNLITYARVHVICSNGEVFGVNVRDDGHYYVTLGELDPNETYHLRIELRNDEVYESEPLYPLQAPGIKQLSYTLADDGETVQVRITNEDPHSEMYYMWTFDEHWEINTPLKTEWRYDRPSQSIVRLEQNISRGWCHCETHPVLLGNNLDYGNGAVKDHVLYTLNHYDKRFNTRYHTKVHQTTISKAEYEYYKQMEAQSSQTGGIFTLMPTQLPTNIHSNKGLKAEGYIGVRLNAADAELYINRSDVGYKLTRETEIIPDSIISKEPWIGVWHDRGYRIFHYDLTTGKSEWTKPWCVDCRDSYWEATLERPDFWNDE